MTATIAALGLDKLSEDESLALANELWARAPRNPAPLTPALTAELNRRLAEGDANPEDVIPWEQVRDEARARFMS